MYSFYRRYRGRLSHVASCFMEHWEGGLRFPACGADDAQAGALAKVRPPTPPPPHPP
jgi:hypothetical protein